MFGLRTRALYFSGGGEVGWCSMQICISCFWEIDNQKIQQSSILNIQPPKYTVLKNCNDSMMSWYSIYILYSKQIALLCVLSTYPQYWIQIFTAWIVKFGVWSIGQGFNITTPIVSQDRKHTNIFPIGKGVWGHSVQSLPRMTWDRQAKQIPFFDLLPSYCACISREKQT